MASREQSSSPSHEKLTQRKPQPAQASESELSADEPSVSAAVPYAQHAPHLLAPGDLLRLQRTVGNQATAQIARQALQRAPAPPTNNTGLPDSLKTGVEARSGVALDDVQVHYNSSAPGQVGAAAFTEGSSIHVGPGQEQHLAHEAWHVVQQKQGRVAATAEVDGVGANVDAALEQEADQAGADLHAAVLARLPSAAAVERSAAQLGQPRQLTVANPVRQFKCGNAPPQEIGVFNRAEQMVGDGVLERGEIQDVRVAVDAKKKGGFKYVNKSVQQYRVLDDQYLWYHGTKKTAVASILQSGLDPNYGGSQDVDTTAENSKGHVYLFPTKVNASGYARGKYGGSKATTLSVRLPVGTIITVDPEIMGGDAVRTATVIPGGNLADAGL